ncbi:MAG TPA: hypothetical protein VGX50_07300 [Longimicrobium sp.]|jgi:hypothetical protein|nr:hypothetical protein [Longimicrobium sp.]
MPSFSLRNWQMNAGRALNELEAARRTIRGTTRGRRIAMQQMNQVYVVLLLSQFQRFCRELHEECVEHLLRQPGLQPYGEILNLRFIEARKLDSGNPNPGNLGSDFGRLGVKLWPELRQLGSRSKYHHDALETLNHWRNAIAHQDFRRPELRGRRTIRLTQTRRWRDVCNRLAIDMDRVMYAYLLRITGSPPW